MSSPLTLDRLDSLLARHRPPTERPVVNLDFETRSPVDLKSCGPSRYADEAQVLCLAYSVDGGDPVLWLPGDPFPEVLAEAELHAWNAGFERAIWGRCGTRLYGWPDLPPPGRWVDTQARAALAGLPLALGQCAQALGLQQQKDKRGAFLIRKLCVPQRDGAWCNDPDLLVELYDYCVQDVIVEREIGRGLPRIPAFERAVWDLTTTINERGVPVDLPAAAAAVGLVERAHEALNDEVSSITGGDVTAVSQVARLRSWLLWQTVDLPDLRAETLDEVLAREDLPDDVRKVVEVRRAVGLASVKKYAAVVNRACADGRVRDTLRYHGAATGRWSSVGLQVQNIKRPTLSPEEVDAILSRIPDGGRPARSHLDSLHRLSDCVRGVVKAAPGRVLVASDYSQIELRVLLWLAEDDANLQELREGRDPYKAMAADVFSVEYDDVDKDQRQIGKAAVLGCGYQLGAATFAKYAAGYGCDLTDDDAALIVEAYRTKYSKVRTFWYELNDAALKAMEYPGEAIPARRVQVRRRTNGQYLEIRLPSGRPIRYFRPRIVKVEKPWGMVDSIEFEGIDTYTRRWSTTQTYGGKLVENVTQGFARDVMAAGMLNAERDGLPVIMTIHDEVVCEVPEEQGDTALDKLNAALLRLPPWAAGLPLAVEGWTGTRYRK